MTPTPDRSLPRRAMRIVAAAALGLVLLWGVAVPSFPGAHPPGWHPDTSAALATLRILAEAQRQFVAAKALDRDADGNAEFGWLSQLAGAAPPLLSPCFRQVEGGCVERGGYVVQLWLPAAGETWITEGSASSIDAAAAASRWCAYAWPREDSSATAALFVDASGQVLRRSGARRRYVGRAHPVPVDAALPSSAATTERGEGGHVGRDGERWILVN